MLNFNEKDMKKTNYNDGLFEGVFSATIVGHQFKRKLGDEYVRTDEPDPHDNTHVWEIEVKIGKGTPRKISIWGGEPFEGKPHNWVKVFRACGVNPKDHPDKIIGKEVKVLVYSEKQNSSGKTWSTIWNKVYSPETDSSKIEEWFRFAVENSKRLADTINPESRYVEELEITTKEKELPF